MAIRQIQIIQIILIISLFQVFTHCPSQKQLRWILCIFLVIYVSNSATCSCLGGRGIYYLAKETDDAILSYKPVKSRSHGPLECSQSVERRCCAHSAAGQQSSHQTVPSLTLCTAALLAPVGVQVIKRSTYADPISIRPPMQV